MKTPNYNRTIDSVLELERQVYSDGNNLAKERADLERLELQKQDIERQQRINEQLKQQLELARQQELIRIELLRQEQAKQAEEKKQEEIARLKVPADNFITAQSRYKLFDIAREHKEFFTKQTTGDYEYWTSRNGDIDVHKTHININVSTDNLSDKTLKLGLDVAISQFGNELKINGSDEFIRAIIEVIAGDERYSSIKLNNPEHQEMLDSKRLDLEIEKAVDLDLDNIPDLDLTNVPDLDLNEYEQDDEIEQKLDRGMSR